MKVRGWERMDASVYLQGKVKFERMKSVVSESFVVSCYGFSEEAVTVGYVRTCNQELCLEGKG